MEGDIRIPDRTDVPGPNYEGEYYQAQPCPGRLLRIRHSSNQGNSIKGARSCVLQDDRRGKVVLHRESADMGATEQKKCQVCGNKWPRCYPVGGLP